MSGLKIAALYGIIPHQLGFCGPLDKTATGKLLDFLSGKAVLEKEIRNILREFKGAFSYYESIAKSNKIRDPFDERVVKAYWLGNKLLEKAKISEKFPFHLFHVLKVGSITGRIVLRGKLLDLCRISWGQVEEIKKIKVLIRYQPLRKYKKRFSLDKLTKKEVSWNKSIAPVIKTGQMVSLHWNYIIQVLNKKELNNLKKYTQITLKKINARCR